MNDMSIAKVDGAASGGAESPVGSNEIELCIGALQMGPGVVAARASAFTNAVYVEYPPDHTDFAAVRAAIESAGYRAMGRARQNANEPKSRRWTLSGRRGRRNSAFWCASSGSPQKLFDNSTHAIGGGGGQGVAHAVESIHGSVNRAGPA